VRKFTLIDHTADIGIRIFGESPQEIFVHAAEAFFQILTDPRKIEKMISHEVSIQGRGFEEMLVAWLNEFIYLFDTRGLLFTEFEILSLDEHKVDALARGETYDEERHPIRTAVKGATYHQLRVYRERDIWRAQIILDI